MRFEKVDVSFEEGSRIKAENRSAKIALLASMSAEDRQAFNERNKELLEKIAADFQGYKSD